jgi:DNA polymerase elongation subunit (family B)
VSPLTGQRFRTDVRGILPFALEQMIALRKYYNDLKASLPPGTPEWFDADRRSTAYKVAANSFYGVVGSPFSRFYDAEIAEAVTQAGKWLLVNVVMDNAEKRKMESVYGDTDSAFIGNTDVETFRTFVKECNEKLIPEAIAAVGCSRNDIKLAYEKAFRVLVFVSAKRYIGYYLHYKGKAAAEGSKPEVKGLEYKRGDSNLIARRLQERVINYMGTKTLTPIATYRNELRETMEHVMSGVLDYDQVVMSKNLSRDLRDYVMKPKKDGSDGAVPAHVIVGRILEERGLEVGEGTRVEYVIVDGTSTPAKVIPGIDYAGECDRWYLWESLVYPPTQRLLEAAFPDHNWKDGLESIRPAKPKGRSRVLEGQLGLDLTREAPGQVPYQITIDESLRGSVAELGAVLRRHPGMRPVQIRLRLRSGAIAVLDVPIHVSATKHLESDLTRALWAIVWRSKVLADLATAVS